MNTFLRLAFVALAAAVTTGCYASYGYQAPQTPVVYQQPAPVSYSHYYVDRGATYYVAPHPQYGYVYSGGPNIVIGGVVPRHWHGQVSPYRYR